MSTVFGEMVLRLFKVQIVEYLSSIYDYFNIILTCKSMKLEIIIIIIIIIITIL